MRDLIERIASKTIDKKRPEVRIGHVHHVDSGRQLAWILYPGENEESLVKVRAALNMLPSRTIEQYGDTADIVRVAGKPGSYYITDFVRGGPLPPAGIAVPTGAISMWPTTASPGGYLLCDGAVYNNGQYPALAALLGNKFGGVVGTSFAVPDLRGRIPLGVSSVIALAANEGVAEALRSLAHTHAMTHTHTVTQHTHGAGAITLTKATNTTASGAATRITDIGGNTGDITGSPPQSGAASTSATSTQPATGANSLPFLGINFIIKV
jgi:microcystin-dependent protein